MNLAAPSPSDSSIAQAFREYCYYFPNAQITISHWVQKRAREIDDSAPAAAVGGEDGPRLDKPATIRSTTFGVGVKWSTVIERAQREHEYQKQEKQERKNTPAAPVGGFVVVPPGWKFDRAGIEAFVSGPNGGGWFERKGTLWQRTLFDLVDALAKSPAAQSSDSALDTVGTIEYVCQNVGLSQNGIRTISELCAVLRAKLGGAAQPSAKDGPWVHGHRTMDDFPVNPDSAKDAVSEWGPGSVPEVAYITGWNAAKKHYEATTAAGLVDVVTDESVEAKAEAMFNEYKDAMAAPWDRQWIATRGYWRKKARAALEAAIGREVGESVRVCRCGNSYPCETHRDASA